MSFGAGLRRLIFLAYQERRSNGVNFAYLQNGSTVAVTGVCRIGVGNQWWRTGPDWRANSSIPGGAARGTLKSLQSVALAIAQGLY